MDNSERAKRDWIPTPWDYFFDKQASACFVLCHLKSGGLIGGFYGTSSYASDYPNPQQLYLQELWIVTPEGRFIEKVSETLGGIIRFEECSVIEFINADVSKSAAVIEVPQFDYKPQFDCKARRFLLVDEQSDIEGVKWANGTVSLEKDDGVLGAYFDDWDALKAAHDGSGVQWVDQEIVK